MAKIFSRLMKIAAVVTGFAAPYIRTKTEAENLKEDIAVLSQDNEKLRKENDSLKRQLLILAVIAALSFTAFAAVMIAQIII